MKINQLNLSVPNIFKSAVFEKHSTEDYEHQIFNSLFLKKKII